MAGAALVVLIALSAGFWWSRRDDAGRPVPDRPTFHRDIAPILHARCAPCHQPGESGPFSLLTFADAHRRARQIAEVTSGGLMPPWLPAGRPGVFVGDRRLRESEKETLRRWAAQEAPEGPGPERTPPARPGGWRLGTPDLVVSLPEPFALAPEGRDVYRNFVLPLTNTTRRFVRALEFQPGNARLVHHAFFRLDNTRASRQRDEAEPGPGFAGLHTPASAQAPEGHFLSWQPGQASRPESDDMAWPLEPGTDLVLQVHLRPTGKPEQVQPAVALYFTDTPPRRQPLTWGMRLFDLDIPAGATAHVVRDSLELPVAVDVLALLPHAHSLGRSLRAFATLPGGGLQPLLDIPRWDVSWQGDYRYARPVSLPAGTVVTLEYLYDNSTNNPANPHHPPARVGYGLQSDDEMAELWLQLLPRNPRDRETLLQARAPRILRESLGYHRYLLTLNPSDARALSELGKAHVLLGDHRAAEPPLRAAMQAQPDLDDPHYWLGLSLRQRNRLGEARTEFAIATRLNPANSRAWGNLGLVLLEQGDPSGALGPLRRALALQPGDTLAREALAAAEQALAAPRR